MNGVVVGLSGGIDSAVVLSLAKLAFPNNTLAIFIDIESSPRDHDDAIKIAKAKNILIKTINLTNEFKLIKNRIGVKEKLSIANIKPRLRMLTLYAYAQENKYLVLGTDNAAELLLGYFTKFGDGGVDLLPISQLTKNEVKELAKELKIPDEIINKKPTAGLWENQFDEDELGFSYNYVDAYIKKDKIPNEIKLKIKKQNIKTDHKRNMPPMPIKMEEMEGN